MAIDLPLRNRSWRPQRLYGEQARRRRRVRRAVVTLLLAALLAAYVWVVTRPLSHVNTHLLFLAPGANQGPLDYRPPYLEQTYAAMAPLGPSLYRTGDEPGRPQRLPGLNSAQSLRDVATQLRQRRTSADAIVLFVAAGGLVIDGQPSLLCANFDPLRPEAGAVSLKSLLAELQLLDTAAVKLLLLDTGYHGHDPRLGKLVDDFVHRLETIVRENGDPRLWVLAAHASNQRPHVAPAIRRTVFSFFVTEGLRGAADADRDQLVSVAELHQFVDSNVAHWSDLATGGRELQTTRLLHAQQRAGSAKEATLLSVAEIEPELRSIDLAGAIEAAELRRTWLPPVATAATASNEVALVRQLPPLPKPSDALPQRRQAWQTFLGSIASTAPDAAAGDPSRDSGDSAPAEASEAEAGPEGDESGEAPYDQRTVDLHRERAAIVGQLLRLRDEIAADVYWHQAVIERAPHLWREFESRLFEGWDALEIHHVAASDTRFEELRKLIPTIESLAARRDQLPLAQRGLARQFAEAWNDAPQPPQAPNLASALQHEPSPELLDVAGQFDGLLEAKSPPDFTKLLEQAAAFDELEELRLLAQLAIHPASWRVRQLALQAARLAHQVTEFGGEPVLWVADQIQRGDTLRNDAMRDLLPANSPARQAAAERKLTAACEAYLEAAETIQVVYLARLVSRRCLYDLPALLTYSVDSLDASPRHSIAADRLGQLLIHVERLDDLLGTVDPQKLMEVQLELDLAVRQLQRVSRPLTAESVEHLINTRLPEDRAGVDALAVSNLLNAVSRRRLLDNRLVLDKELAERFASAEQAPPKRLDASLRSAATQRRWEAYLAATRVAFQLVDYAASQTASPQPLLQLEQAIESRERQDARWRAVAELEDTMSRQLSELPLLIDRQADGDSDSLQAAQRALLLLDVRDTARVASHRAAQRLRGQQLAEFLRWRSRAARMQQAFASSQRRGELDALAGRFAAAARSVTSQPLEDDARPRLQLTAPERIDWFEGRAEPIQIELRNDDAEAVACWVIIDTDDPAVDLLRAGNIYSLDAPPDRAAALRLDSPPTLRLQPGQSRQVRVPFVVKSEVAGAAPVRIHVAASRRLELDGSADVLGLHVVPVVPDNAYLTGQTWINAPASPDVELHVSGPANCVEPLPDGFRLLAFPNRDTGFQLGISSRSAQASQVTVELLRPSVMPTRLPAGSLTGEQAAVILRQLGKLTPVVPPMPVELKAPGQVVGLPLPLTEDSGSESPPGDASGTGASTAAMQSGEGGEPLPRAMIAVVRAADSDLRLLRQLRVHVQHPRRYAVAQASYSLQRQRIEIEVRAKSGATLPEGPLKVEAELEQPLTAGLASRLEASLNAQTAARLHIDLPPTAQLATLHLHLDGYPRAFSFRVPCNTDSTASNLVGRSVRVRSPSRHESFLAPTPTIAARIEVDAPPGAFDLSGNFVEVGVDRDMDRDFQGDRTVRLRADRQITARLSETNAGGLMTIRTTVDDFSLKIPTDGLQNIRANLLAQLHLGQVVAQDAAEEIWLDGLPPRVIVQDVRPGPVLEAGTALELTVDCIDDQFGFVRQLQAAFDTAGAGEFVADSAVSEGEKLAGTRWNVSVPTDGLAPGRHLLLLRATDHVGNTGQYASMRVQIVPASPADEPKLGVVRGVVRYREQPASDATITIESTGAPVDLDPAELASNEQGEFQFEQVPPGQYRLTVRLLRRNRRLKLEQEVEVQADKNAPLAFDFK